MNHDIGVTVSTSNALFTQVNFPVRPTYVEELRRLYGDDVDIVPLDFAFRPRTTLRRMNGFVASNTRNMIRNMFTQPIDAGTKAVISNCIYFNGSWEYEFLFEPGIEEGRNASFHTFSGDTQVTYMSAKLDFPYYGDDALGMEILSLPYEHDARNEEISEYTCSLFDQQGRAWRPSRPLSRPSQPYSSRTSSRRWSPHTRR